MVKSVTVSSSVLLLLGALALGCNDSKRSNVFPPPPPGFQVSTSTLPNGTDTQAYDTTLATANGQSPYTWAVVSGAPPTGVTLGPTDGRLSGTITAPGTFNFRVRVTDGGGEQAERDLTILVSAQPVAWNAGSPFTPGTVGAAYGINLNQSVTGGTSPITFQVVQGALPPGISLDEGTGFVSGTPTQAGNYSVSVRATSAPDPATGVQAQAEKGTFFQVN